MQGAPKVVGQTRLQAAFWLSQLAVQASLAASASRSFARLKLSGEACASWGNVRPTIKAKTSLTKASCDVDYGAAGTAGHTPSCAESKLAA
ncbi:hypothetical protein ACVWXP_003762 [Bradyrhizobium sp. USDA 4463]